MRFSTVIAMATALAGCGTSSSISSVGMLSETASSASAASAEDAAEKKPFDPFGLREDRVGTGRVVIKNPTLAEVMQPGSLPDIIYGNANAKVTVIKYASLTCPFCRKFHRETYPAFKREYIDTGKVRFILREFPIGFQSGTATVAWRCAPKPKRLKLYGLFMEQQSRWVSQEVRRDAIFKVAKQVGMNRREFDACYENKELIAGLKGVKDRGRTLGIIGTPNFFINDQLEKRVLTIRDLREIIDPMLDGRAVQTSARAN